MEEAVRSLLIETGDLPGAEAAYAKWDEAGNEIDFSDIDEPDPPVAPTVPPGGAPPSPETEKAAA
jgi:hypothetical protein